MFKLLHNWLISHTSKVMLKILQVRLQQYVNQECPDGQGGFRKGRGSRDQTANIHWITEKVREFQKNIYFCFISSVQFSHSVMFNYLWPHGQKHARPPCPSPTLRACSNSCPLSHLWHPTISSSLITFSSCLQSFPASESFPMSHFFTSDDQSNELSVSASPLPK